MYPNDLKTFGELWLASWQLSGNNRIPNDMAISLAFDDLSMYQLEHVKYALQLHRKNSKFPPTVADVVEIINDYCGYKHISAEEAWAIALISFDENSTVVWTEQIAQARAIAAPVFYEGDKVAARMTFKDAYSRIVKVVQTPPVWSVCQGFDKEHRAIAVEQAAKLGRVSTQIAAKYQLEPPTVNFLQLVDMSAAKNPQSDLKTKLESLRAALNFSGSNEKTEVERRAKERQEFEQHRAKELQRIQAIIESQQVAA
jgi:hypothetical protein